MTEQNASTESPSTESPSIELDSQEAPPVLSIKDQLTYESLRADAEKPQSQRPEINMGRGGAPRTARKYHLTDAEKQKLESQSAGVGGTINPFEGRVGLYYFQVQSLISLGKDNWHSLKTIYDKLEELTRAHKLRDGRTQWDKINSRKERLDANNPKDLKGRMMQNFKVLQRIPKGKELNPYGTKLQQLKMCIDIEFTPLAAGFDPSLGTWHYRLNTQFASIDAVSPSYVNPVAKRGRKPGTKVVKKSVKKQTSDTA